MKTIKPLILITLLSVSLFSCKEKQEVKKSEKPNIIYILADDLGYGDVSSYNKNSKIQTPNIDALAKQGVRFTDAHTSSSVCTPTRYGILTGRYNWRTRLKKGVVSGYSKSLIQQETTTVAELLKDNGYSTAYIGKWHLGWDWAIAETDSLSIDHLKARPTVDFSKPVTNGPNSHGFDYSYGFCGSLDMPPYVWVENGVATSIPDKTTKGKRGQGTWRKGLTANNFSHEQALPQITARTVDYINLNASTEKPFFLYMPLPAPHTPILPTKEFQGKSNLNNPYADFVLMVDWVVGEVTKTLKANGIDENTLIVFTSDNGCSPAANFKQLTNQGHDPSDVYRGFKSDIYEGGHRVPYIMSWKGTIKPTVSEQLVCTTDFFATAADAIGVEFSEDAGVDSYSHLGVSNIKSEMPVRKSIIHHSVGGQFAYRKGDWKLIYCPGSGGWSYPNKNSKAVYSTLPKMQLYNLAEDVGEENNVQAEHKDLIKEYRAELLNTIENGRSTDGALQKNDKVESWPQLDYIKENKY